MSVFEELKARKVALVMTEQTFDELYRNRAAILAQVIESVQRSTKVVPYTTTLIRHFSEFSALAAQREALESSGASLVEKLREMLRDITKDPVFGHLKDLMMTPEHLSLSTRPDLIAKAQTRKMLGNPPTSRDKWTIGDELIWETLLDGCPDNLIIVSRDHTFRDNETLLRVEFERRESRLLVAVVEKLGEALKMLGKASPKIEEQERAVVHERNLSENSPCPHCGGVLEETGYDGSDGDTAMWLFCTKCHREYFPA